MRKFTASVLPGLAAPGIMLLCAAALPAQNSHYVIITPDRATLLIGDSQTFRLVDQNGRKQSNVSWSVSDHDAVQMRASDELTITAKRSGEFRIRALSANGEADATVTIMEGAGLPIGTTKWSAGTVKGCKTTKITPAVPSANGPDVYEQSQCEDGQYVAAYTADGVQLWRRKLNSIRGAAVPGTSESAGPAATERLNIHSSSICDSVSVGTNQQKIRELLAQQNLGFSEGAPGEHMWIVEESGAQCKLWFDEKFVLTKKRKILVSE